MDLVIDVGNTRVKTAVFESGSVVFETVFDKEKILLEIEKIILKFSISSAIISAVATLSEEKLQKLRELLDVLELNHQTKVPFKNKYGTPKTLGVDRIALASGAVGKFPNENVLVIDAGTCITYDFINKKGEYLGGAISPGIRIRYRALHDYTSKLPLLKTKKSYNYIGNNTNNSMHSGVINGVVQEITGVINQYEIDFKGLTIVLTGGDAIFLAKQLKSGIFANQNFLLEGLQSILIFNKKIKSQQ